jgi:hypothetical protein
MAFKLTKQEQAQRSDLVGRLIASREELDHCLGGVHDALEMAAEALRSSVEAYNELVEEARGFAADIAAQAEEDIGEKSERWQEGERGEAAQEWQREWENAEWEEVELPTIERISFDNLDHADVLDGLPEAAV